MTNTIPALPVGLNLRTAQLQGKVVLDRQELNVELVVRQYTNTWG